MTTMDFLPQDIIRDKREKRSLTADQIQAFARGIADHTVSDAQIAAFGMAVYFNGMTARETASLTTSMRDSGTVVNWLDHGFDHSSPIVDKHSTGGVGDKVSFMLAAIMAAAGAYVPMIAGRGLGHTGGTIDKLESIPGYQTNLNQADFIRVTQSVGASIIGQTEKLAPADRRFYAVRDVTATVESIPLITASILSKKMAAGLNALVMDIKVGTGAFMESLPDAEALARTIIDTARAAGLPTAAVITDMNQVLGRSAGNAVEIGETIEFLTSPESADKRLKQVVFELAAVMLQQAGLTESLDKGRARADQLLTSGAAAEKFAQMVVAHGGPADLLQNPQTHLQVAPVETAVYASIPGYISAMNVRAIGQAIVAMKGGRSSPGEAIDLSVGLTNFAQIGDPVDDHHPLCVLHTRSQDQADTISEKIRAAITVSPEKPTLTPVVREILQ